MKYLEQMVIQIIHFITEDHIKHIKWELGGLKTNDARLSVDDIEFENCDQLQGTGYSLIGFTIGYLGWYAKLENGWVPPEFQ